jgi:hypothetical protein
MLDQLEHHFILFSTVFLLIGYLLGTHFKNIKSKNDDKIESFFNKEKKRSQVDNKPKKSTIDIDDSTHVVKIKTDGLEKKYEEIGNKQTTSEDISSSINKLKNLKR